MKSRANIQPDSAPHRPALFEAFPDLEGKLAWTHLDTSPSPVERMTGLGHDNLWIKRDDVVSSIYGGNKVRKLEFALADVIRRGKKNVFTMGGIGTNHGLATAIYCNRLGLSSTILLYDQPVTSTVRKNLLLINKYATKTIYTKTHLNTGVQFYITRRLMNPGAYFLYPGGSNPVGTIGFVSAAFELKKQIDEGLMPEPKAVFCALGSKGTLSGLSLGLALAGVKAKVIGVQVTMSHIGPVPIATQGTAGSLAHETHKLLMRLSPTVPKIDVPLPAVVEGYLGDGYGFPTEKGMTASEKLKACSACIALEPTYTAKTCAAFLDYAADPSHAGEPLLFWNTFNSRDFSAEIEALNYRNLPSYYHPLFECETVA